MPTARLGLAAVTGPDGRIYALGGYAGGYLNAVEAYDTTTNTWSSLAPMSTARTNFAAAVGSDGRIYALGGYAGDGGGWLNTVEAYDLRTNSWASVTPMTFVRSDLAAATGPDGRIYAIGGWYFGYSPNGLPYASVEAYDSTTNAWSMAAPMPTARQRLAAATGLDGRIYALGGSVGYFDQMTTVEVYNTTTNSWSTAAPMLTARSRLAAATGDDGHIYALGGFNYLTSSVLNTAEVYTPDTTAPATTLSVGTPSASGSQGAVYVTSKSPLTLTATDPDSAVQHLYYRFYAQGAPPPPYTSAPGGTSPATTSFTISGSGLKDGVYAVDYYASDNLGNAGQVGHQLLTLDTTAPSASLSIGQPQATIDGVTYVTKDTPFTLTASDGSGAGVASLAYRFFSQGSTPPAYTAVTGATATFTLSGANGVYEVDYEATDYVGNDPALTLLVSLTESFPGANIVSTPTSAPSLTPTNSVPTPTTTSLAATGDQPNPTAVVFPSSTRHTTASESFPWGWVLGLGGLLVLLGLGGLCVVLYRAEHTSRSR